MKAIIKYITYTLTVSLFFSITSCEDFLDEKNYSKALAETYITEDNARELVTGTYDALRDVYKKYDGAFYGTDIYTQQGQITSFKDINEYVRINSDNGTASDIWKKNYQLISRANVALGHYQNKIQWSPEKIGDRDQGIAEAKVLRALGYYNLVQNFGGVPLVLEEIETIKYDYTRATEEEVFGQIIKDLEEAIEVLAEKVAFGKVTPRAAKHLLADVLVSRGYKSYGSTNDFTEAATLAEEVIGDYDIRSQTYAELFAYNNQQNDEILLSVLYGEGLRREDRDNSKHSICMNSVNDYPGINRKSDYGLSSTGFMPTLFFFSLYEDNDTREEVTFHRVLYANEKDSVDNKNGKDKIASGDTVIYYPKKAISAEELADKLNRYYVYQPDQYYYGIPDNVDGAIYQYSDNNNRTNFPIFKKFDDPNANEDDSGHRDTYLFRVAETHLIAAEAYLKAGKTAESLTHINRVRERATGVADHYKTVDIDDILNERAIELAGEENRWAILKRTGELEKRIKAYNPHIIDHGEFDPAIHYLRPIPSSERELSTVNLEQNPGY